MDMDKLFLIGVAIYLGFVVGEAFARASERKYQEKCEVWDRLRKVEEKLFPEEPTPANA